MREPVIVYSSWSAPTLITSLSAQHLSEWFKANGFDPIEVIGTSANRVRMQRVMGYIGDSGEKKPLVCFFGHGLRNSWVGWEPLGFKIPAMRTVIAGVNDDLFKGGIVVAIACDTAVLLGHRMVEAGTLAYMGSDRPMFVGGFEMDRDYVDDFVDLFTVAQKRLALGDTAITSIQAFWQKGKEYIAEYRRHPEWENIQTYIDAMEMNIRGFQLIGEQDARWV